MHSINLKLISYFLGLLLCIESGFLFLSLLVSIYYGGPDINSFIISIVITLLAGLSLRFAGRNYDSDLRKREGFLIVSLTWIIFSTFGTLPFILSGSITNFVDAFFESISGFTGCGASILNDIESLPHGVLFWRSITQWIGGMGMVVFTIAILPLLKVRGAVTLYNTEAPGLTKEKMTPNIAGTARKLWLIYVSLTGVLAGLLLLGPMNLFDAVCHSFTAMGTGGYSTKQASIAYFNSAYVEYIITLFCFIAGINFSLLYVLCKGKFNRLYKDEEFRWYLYFAVGFTLVTAGVLMFNNGFENIEATFRNALFTVVTIITTCGFATVDYTLWGSFFSIFAILLMLFGGSAGSTSGAMKIIRVVVMIKNALNEVSKQLHPNAVVPVKVNKTVIANPFVAKTLAFSFVYMSLIALGTIVLSFGGSPLEEAMGSVVSCIGGVGPGLGRTGPAGNYEFLPDISKWTLSFLMLVGRLELFTVLVIFTPHFWRN